MLILTLLKEHNLYCIINPILLIGGLIMIRKIEAKDKNEYLQMATDFYHSGAVIAPVGIENIEATFNEMISSDRYVDGYFIDQRNEGLTLDFVSLSDNEIQDILKKEMPDDLFYKTIPNLYQKWALFELQSSDPTWKQMVAITYMDGVCISYIYACDTELYSAERAENALSDAISRTSVKIN